MRNKRRPNIEEQTLFSELPFEENEVGSKTGHDKILEARQHANFGDDELSKQEHVQLVEKPETVSLEDNTVYVAKEKKRFGLISP